MQSPTALQTALQQMGDYTYLWVFNSSVRFVEVSVPDLSIQTTPFDFCAWLPPHSTYPAIQPFGGDTVQASARGQFDK